jgi:hypothetical protein
MTREEEEVERPSKWKGSPELRDGTEKFGSS